MCRLYGSLNRLELVAFIATLWLINSGCNKNPTQPPVEPTPPSLAKVVYVCDLAKDSLLIHVDGDSAGTVSQGKPLHLRVPPGVHTYHAQSLTYGIKTQARSFRLDSTIVAISIGASGDSVDWITPVAVNVNATDGAVQQFLTVKWDYYWDSKYQSPEFLLQRSESKTGEYTTILSTTRTIIADLLAKPTTRYYYRVIPHFGEIHGTPSESNEGYLRSASISKVRAWLDQSSGIYRFTGKVTMYGYQHESKAFVAAWLFISGEQWGPAPITCFINSVLEKVAVQAQTISPHEEAFYSTEVSFEIRADCFPNYYRPSRVWPILYDSPEVTSLNLPFITRTEWIPIE